MKLRLKPLKQNTEFGCLATCYAVVRNYFFGEQPFDAETESELCQKAFAMKTGANEHHYLKLLAQQGCEIQVSLESPYLVDVYERLNTQLGCHIQIEHAIVGVADYKNLLKQGYLLITLVDRYVLDMYVHIAHYVVVHGFDESNLYLLDPMHGKEIRFSKERFGGMLASLTKILGYSPLLFAIKRE